MKIVSISDLHLEHHGHKPWFGLSDTILWNGPKADVLILAGDIVDTGSLLETKYRARVREIFSRFSQNYKNVIYVMGNHEHYNGDFFKTQARLNEFLFEFKNIVLLEKTGIMIDDVRFFGGTMWTDLSDPIQAMVAKNGMNDYHLVENSGAEVSYRVREESGLYSRHSRPGRLLPSDTTQDHLTFIKALKDDLELFSNRYVVVTHHSPSYVMCDPIYVNDDYNPCYHNKLENLILDNPRIKRWYCGHTHRGARHHIGECEIILNPRGYPGENKVEYELAETEL